MDIIRCGLYIAKCEKEVTYVAFEVDDIYEAIETCTFARSDHHVAAEENRATFAKDFEPVIFLYKACNLYT